MSIKDYYWRLGYVTGLLMMSGAILLWSITPWA